MELFARKCIKTGEGMNSGYVYNDGKLREFEFTD